MKAKIVKEKFKVVGHALPIKPSVAGKCLYDIYKSNNHKLTADVVLKKAKSKSHPLHSCFEWNNSKAAQAYRLNQARKIIACVVIEKMVGRKSVSVRAFLNIKQDEKGNLTHNPFNSKGQNYFVTMSDAMQNDFMRVYTVEAAILEINRWMEKYKNLKKLSSLFKVIKKKVKKIK